MKKVKDFMSKKVISFKKNDSISDVVKAFYEKRISGARSLIRLTHNGWLISSGAKTGMPCDAANSATESNQTFSRESSLWVKTAAISKPFLNRASMPTQPIL